IGEKNRYAQVLLVLLPLAFSRMRGERSRLLRLLAAGCAALIFSGVVLTFSRGGAIAAAVVLAGAAVVGLLPIRQVLALAARLAGAYARSGRPEMAQLAQAFLLALGAYLVAGLFLQLAYQRYFWLIVALANSTIWVLRREAEAQRTIVNTT